MPKKALPSVSIAELFRNGRDPGRLFTSRLTRKRVEWAHEKEWRYLVGKVGPKHLLDTALRRVFLGPRMPQAHADRVMAAVAGRPIEVVQGTIEGFELRFATVQAATDEAVCARAVPGRFVPTDDLRSADTLRKLLKVPLASLRAECERLAQHPNMTHFDAIEVSGTKPGTLFITTWYRLRNGREIHRQRYYDSYMRMVHED